MTELVLPEPGTVIDGKYEVVRQLGRGAMGIVYAVQHRRLDQRFAVKILLPTTAATNDLKRFEREARAAARLKSPHVARVIDVANTPEGLPYMVMELLEGHDLDCERLTRGRMPYGEVVDYILQACAAIGEAHGAGIIHRDLKPANIFLARDPEGERRMVKVLDFGISKWVDDDARLTTVNECMGTPLYMSPEQIRSSAVVDGRTDIWSLGVMLYELISGEPPWWGTTLQVTAAIISDPPKPLGTVSDAPAALCAVIHRMLAKERDERYATITDVAAALAPFCRVDSIGESVARTIASRVDSAPGLKLNAAPDSSPSQPSRSIGLSAEEAADTIHHEMRFSEVRRSAAAPARSRKRTMVAGAAAVLALVATVAIVARSRPQMSAPEKTPSLAEMGSASPTPTTSALPIVPSTVAPPALDTSPAASPSSSPALVVAKTKAATTRRPLPPPTPTVSKSAHAPPPETAPTIAKPPLFIEGDGISHESGRDR
jgi:serine/threonine-protein kinase